MDHEQILDCYAARIHKLTSKMKEENIDAVVFRDSEEHRNPAVRYFCRVPNDAILVIGKDSQSLLAVWDINLAKTIGAFTQNIFPFSAFNNAPITATAALLKKMGIKENSRIEIDTETSYPMFLEYVEALPQYDIVCRKESVHSYVNEMRSVKDEIEIEFTKTACNITDEILDAVIDHLQKGIIKTETDVALFIEAMCRAAGCEKTSFETLAAGPERSFAIHAFPNYTNGAWGSDGLSILDFGVCFEGYASDVTLTIARGNLNEKQEKMLALVQKAADECLQFYKPGLSIRQAAIKADKIFATEKMKMPHTLGHGIGLEIHEYPRIKAKLAPEDTFKSGMIVTLEPGLYDAECGGVRLENDVLITEDGNQVLTKSKIIRL